MSETNAQQTPNIKEILADYDKATAFLASLPAEAWEGMQAKTAMAVYNKAITECEAYPDFLKEHGLDPKDIDSYEKFGQLPLIDKDNYYKKYHFNQTNPVKAGKDLYSFALSSGTSGTPTLWPRYFQAEESAHVMFGLLMRLYWQIDKRSTLFVNAANLGVYASGIYMNAAVKPLTQKYPITLATTGSDLDNIVHTIVNLAPFYDQTIFVTYPTFMRTVLDRLENSGVDLRKLNLKIFIGGEGHTVEWRRYINEIISGNKDDVLSIIDGYTVTETSMAGIGTPLSNLIRNHCADNPELAEKLFGDREVLPTLSQFNPMSTLIESIGNEIIMTSSTNTPLVRYNIHDRGGVIRFRDMERVLEEFGIDYKEELKQMNVPLETIWQQPFAYVFGRRDDTVIMGGGNIFPEQIEPVLFEDGRKDIHSMKLKMIPDEKQHQLMYVFLELKEDLCYTQEEIRELEKKYHNLIFDRLMEVNADYAIAYRSDPEYSDPIIKIYPFATGPFEGDLDRTKPRLVIHQ